MFYGLPGRTVGHSRALMAYLTGPGCTTDTHRLSGTFSHLQIFTGIFTCLLPLNKIFADQTRYSESLPAQLGIHETHRLRKRLA